MFMIWYMTLYMIWYTIYDMIYDIWYDMIWYMIWYDIIWYDMIYLSTAIGLPPGGSSTVHIYTQTIHRTTQQQNDMNNKKTTQTTNLKECWPCPVFASFTLVFALQLREKHGKPSVREAEERSDSKHMSIYASIPSVVQLLYCPHLYCLHQLKLTFFPTSCQISKQG
jgi:hypothetical protein